MANSYKNIVITPNTGSATGDPTVVFSGGNTTVNTDVTLRVYPESNGTISFEGSAGQLFSITNDLSNSIFSVNDVSGIPLIEVNVSSQQITLGQFYGNVGIGTNAANSSIYKLNVNGTINASNILINGNAITVSLTPANNYAGVMANSSNAYANATFGTITNTTAAFAAANQAGVVANNANTFAVSAFVRKSGDTITGDLVVQGNLTTTGSITDSKGNVRDVPLTTQSAIYALTISDVGNVVSTSANVFVPNAVFTAGHNICVFNNSAATISITGNNVVLRLAGQSNSSNKLLSQNGVVNILCVAANNFVLSGAGLS